MMTPDEIAKLIPDAVVEAGAKTEYAEYRKAIAAALGAPVSAWPEWDELDADVQKGMLARKRVALAAGLAAWPKMVHDHFNPKRAGNLILPLPADGGRG